MAIKNNKNKVSIAAKSKANASSAAFNEQVAVEAKSSSLEQPNNSAAQLTGDANRVSIVSDLSETFTHSNMISETSGVAAQQSKCSFFAAVGSLFSNLNCKKNRKLQNSNYNLL
jgi:hypothetical protein